MVYVEPTPYIVALVEKLRDISRISIEVYYIATDLSQKWRLQIDGRHASILSGSFFAKIRTLWRALSRDSGQTVLHLAGWGHPVLLAALLMARVRCIPVAVESDTAEGQLNGSWQRSLKDFVYPLLFRLPNRFLPGGTRQASYLQRFGVKAERMTIAQMTVDVCAIDRFCTSAPPTARSDLRARWRVPTRAKIGLYMGRLEPYKGVEMLLAAFAVAAQEEKDLRLVIAGDGTMRPIVEAAAAHGRTLYLGRLAGNDVLRAYLAADFLILPSLFEPWGLVINEAMACGLPTIVSDRVGCADDLIRHAETGLVVGAGREDELTAAILHLARDAPSRGRMAQAAKTLISDWTLSNEACNILSAWNEISP